MESRSEHPGRPYGRKLRDKLSATYYETCLTGRLQRVALALAVVLRAREPARGQVRVDVLRVAAVRRALLQQRRVHAPLCRGERAAVLHAPSADRDVEPQLGVGGPSDAGVREELAQRVRTPEDDVIHATDRDTRHRGGGGGGGSPYKIS